MTRVVVTGASGLIGSALVESLRADGIQVTTLVRRHAEGPDEVEWLTGSAPLDPAVLAGARAVVVLIGASIGRLPWTRSYRRELIASRLTPTRAVAHAVRALGDDAPALICASGVGYYGSRPGAEIDESAPRGNTFLAELCGAWEAAARAPRARVVHLRTAPVLHRDGVLRPLVLLTRLGLSGRLASGRQVWPWISLADHIRAVRHVIDTDIAGPVNLSAPARTTANDLGFALAVTLNRPFLVPVPAWALRLGLGKEAAEGLLLCDAHVVPAALAASGFDFRDTDVEAAVADALERPRVRL